MSKKLVQFSRTRDDLLFSYGGELMDGVLLRLRPSDPFGPESGVIFSEADGFDFPVNLKPELEINFSSGAFVRDVGLDPSGVEFHVTIEDLALLERVSIADYPVDELLDVVKSIPIDLSSRRGLYFSQGFEIGCYLHRSVDAKEKRGAWSKSHVLLNKSFIAKSSEEDALFDINWIKFEDPEEAKDVWYYVNWNDMSVAEAPGSELFCVFANDDLRQQFKRLENNSHFGHLSIRQMASEVLSEIIFTTLVCADLNGEPQSESLQEQIQLLLLDYDMEFQELALAVQGSSSLELEQLRAQVKKVSQRAFDVGEELRDIKFGGYRAP